MWDFFQKLFERAAQTAFSDKVIEQTVSSAIGHGLGQLFQEEPQRPEMPAMPTPEIPSPAPLRDVFARPGDVTKPMFLKMGGTPLQQRAAITTGATQGGSEYRDQAVQDFYRQLAVQQLTDPGGRPMKEAQILPIEWQYAEQLFGEPRERTTRGFLNLLAEN